MVPAAEGKGQPDAIPPGIVPDANAPDVDALDTGAPGGDEPEAVGGRNSPLRRCIATGTVGPKDGMVRFVVGPDGTVVPDVAETLPGRGLWLTADRALVEKAAAKGLFAKAARRAVSVPPDVAGLLAGLLRRRCLELVGLSRRGGGVLAGFEKVQAALRTGQVGKAGRPGLWLEARDGAADGRGKLAGFAARLRVPMVVLFDRRELGEAVGRDEAVHAVIAAGPLSDRLMREIGRLSALELPATAGADGHGTLRGTKFGQTTTGLSDTE